MLDKYKFIIFLDIDGVLCSYDNMREYNEDDGEHSFEQEAVDSLNKIIEYYDADLCMISSWNTKFKDEEQYKQFLISRGVNLLNSELTFGDHCDRSEFIINEINNGLEYYLIIDDEAYGYYESMSIIEYKRILKPNRWRCLDYDDFRHVTENFTLDI